MTILDTIINQNKDDKEHLDLMTKLQECPTCHKTMINNASEKNGKVIGSFNCPCGYNVYF
jgi:ssDNA-binding Zn-finger/Zn-ribbon topoisomerase 1